MLLVWLDFFLNFLRLDFVVDMYDESAVFELVDGVALLEDWSGLGFFDMGGGSSSSCKY